MANKECSDMQIEAEGNNSSLSIHSKEEINKAPPLPPEIDVVPPPLPPEIEAEPPAIPPEITMIPLPRPHQKRYKRKSVQPGTRLSVQPRISSVIDKLIHDRININPDSSQHSAMINSYFANGNPHINNMSLTYPRHSHGISREYLDANLELRLRNYQIEYSNLMKLKQQKTIFKNSKSAGSSDKSEATPLMSINTNIPVQSCNHIPNVGVAIEELQTMVKNLQEQVNAHIENTTNNEHCKIEARANVDEAEPVETLQYIYLESVKCSDHTLLRSLIILIMTSVMKHMMLASTDFAELYGDIDINFVGISRKVKRNEFCLRLVLKLKDTRLDIAEFGRDLRKPYLGRIRKSDRILPTGSEKEIYYVCPKDGHIYLSPQKIYNLLQTTIDKALTNVSSYIEVDKHKYKVVRSVSKLLSLEIDTANIIDKSADIRSSPVIRSEVTIFPEIKLDFSDVPLNFKLPLGEVRDRMMFLRKQLNSDELGVFSAVAYISAEEKNKFSFWFYESIEKAILNGRGSMNIVMEIIEHIRVRHFPVLTVELLKICMIWNALEKKNIDGYWDMKNIEACFISSLGEILRRMDSGWLPDPIFISHNILPALLQKHGLSEENFVPHALHYKDMEKEKMQPENCVGKDTLKNLTSRGLSVIKDVNIWDKQWSVEKQDVRQLRGLISARRWLRTRLERYHKNQNIRVFFL